MTQWNNGIWMSENEIVRRFKDSGCKKSHITILSQLNDCSETEILEIINRHGLEPVSLSKKEKTINTKTKQIQKGDGTMENTVSKENRESKIENTRTDKKYVRLEERISIDELKKMLASGITVNQIAKKLGMEPSTLRSSIKARKINIPPRETKLSKPEDINKAISMLESGMKTKEVAAYFNMDRSYFNYKMRQLKKSGIKPNKTSTIKNKQDEAVEKENTTTLETNENPLQKALDAIQEEIDRLELLLNETMRAKKILSDLINKRQG